MATTKGQRTANRILDSAENEFASHGFEATSLREIAAQVNIQQPGLYKHFASKEELYRQVYARALKPLTDVMEGLHERGGGLESIETLPDELTDLLARHPNIPKLLLRALISDAHDEVAMGWLDELIGFGQKFSEQVGAGQDAEELALQILAVFNVLFGYFWGSPLIGRIAGEAADEAELRRKQKLVLRQFIASIRS